MNYAVRKILANVEHIALSFQVDWATLYDARDDRELIHQLIKKRSSAFARAIEESLMAEWPGDIEMRDSPHGQVERSTIYALPRSRMLALLEEAYNQGALDYGQRTPSLVPEG